MALIKCPECEQLISDKASKCPKCGYLIQEYLDNKAEENKEENVNNISETAKRVTDIPSPVKLRNKKKIIFASCIVAVVVLGVVLALCLFAPRLKVEDISISKWRLTDSTDTTDYYEGVITSEQKKPFIAVIGRYTDEESEPEFVYIEDGKGLIDTSVDTDEDPSIKYRPIGYLTGNSVDISDVKVKYTDSEYFDFSFLQSSSCSIVIDFEMNNSKTGLLVFDLINETNNETERNLIANVIDGKAKYNYWADLPYKSRGVDVSIVPKMFCKSTAIVKEDYVIDKAYTLEKEETSYSNSYEGKEILAFTNYSNGFILYTKELKAGGNKKNRNVVQNARTFLRDGQCTLRTYDSVDEDDVILIPRYELSVVGYITWITLEKEAI